MGVDFNVYRVRPELLDRHEDQMYKMLGLLKTYSDGSKGFDYSKGKKAHCSKSLSMKLYRMNNVDGGTGASYHMVSELMTYLVRVGAPKYLYNFLDKDDAWVPAKRCKKFADTFNKYVNYVVPTKDEVKNLMKELVNTFNLGTKYGGVAMF